MDYKQIRVELLKKVRGNTPKNMLNKRLRHTYDKVGVWERASGATDWEDFVKYLGALKIPLKTHLNTYLNYSGAISDGNALARFITKGCALDEVVWRTKISYSRVRRIMTDSSPKVWEIFSLLDHFYSRSFLVDLIKQIAGEALPIFDFEDKRSQAYLDLCQKNLQYGDIFVLLSHSDIVSGKVRAIDLISKTLKVGKREVKAKLDELVLINVVTRENESYLADKLFYPVGIGREEVLTNTRLFVDRFYESINSGTKSKKAASYFTGMVSDETFLEIQDEMQRMYFKIIQMVDSDEGSRSKGLACTFTLFDPFDLP